MGVTYPLPLIGFMNLQLNGLGPLGPIFDKRGPRELVLAGSVGVVSMFFLMSICQGKISIPAPCTHYNALEMFTNSGIRILAIFPCFRG